jgi:hypothetical protein
VSSPSDFCPLELRLAPEYRRSAVYAALGVILITATLVELRLAQLNNGRWVDQIIFLSFFAVPAFVLLVLALRYRIRIDQHGVWRRRLVRWDLWPWEAFEQGRVRYGTLGDQLTFPEKPWYSRTISASLLGKAERAAYERAIAWYFVPPPLPEPPEAMTVQIGLGPELDLSADGIRFTKRLNEEARLVRWDDVERAEVVRSSRDRPDFAFLELHLPAPIGLVRLKGRGFRMTGGEPEMIAPFLERHLGDARFQVTALRGPPADVAEADRRLARLEKGERDLRKGERTSRYVHAVAVALYSVLMLSNRPNPANWGRADWLEAALWTGALAVLMTLHHLPMWGMSRFRGRELRREREEVRRWRAVLASAEASADSGQKVPGLPANDLPSRPEDAGDLVVRLPSA